MSVYKKLMAARIALQSIKMKKSGLNKFAGYEYFELSDFIPHVQSIFNDLGLCGVVSYEREIATLRIVDVDDPNQQIVITSPMAGASLKGCHDIQNLGAVETYQRRYLWVTAMEILEHDALDSSKPKDTDNNNQLKPGNKELPVYKESDFEANKEAWKKAIQSGKNSANKIASMISAKYTLTDEQKEAIKKLEVAA